MDIQNAIDAGYKVEFVNECLVYDEKGDVFGDYIYLFYKMKEDAERDGNSVLRSVAKLLLNGLYGKTLQKAIFNTTKIINNIFEFNEFVSKYELTEWVVLGDGNKLLSLVSWVLLSLLIVVVL